MGSVIRWLGAKNLSKDGKTTVFESMNRQNSNVKKMNVQVNLEHRAYFSNNKLFLLIKTNPTGKE